MTYSKKLLAVCTTALALGAWTAPAGASEVGIDDGVLRFTAVAGELNDALVVPDDEGGLLVADLGAAPETGDGCEAFDAFASCSAAHAVALALGDGDDVASVDSGITVPATFDGGDGADSLSAGGGPTLLRGGAGEDMLSGGTGGDSIDPGPGTDYVVADGGDDKIVARDGTEDAISCGDGNDSVSADPVDNVDTDCERVTTSGPQPTLADPTASGSPAGDGSGAGAGGDGAGGSAPAVNREERVACAPKRRWVSCAFRLRTADVNGTVDVTLNRGSTVFARGRTRVVNGMAKVRMRTRGPLVNGSYKLRAQVHPDGGSVFKRGWRVGVLVLGR